MAVSILAALVDSFSIAVLITVLFCIQRPAITILRNSQPSGEQDRENRDSNRFYLF
jgi:hypothetical protein